MDYLIKMLESYRHIYVAGAGKNAKKLVELEKYQLLPFKIEGFLVSSLEGNPHELEGIPVFAISSLNVDKQCIAVLVSLSGGYAWNELVQRLIGEGFENIFPLKVLDWDGLFRKKRILALTDIDKEGVPLDRKFGEKNAVYLEYSRENGTSKRMRIYEDRIWHLEERKGELTAGWSLLHEFETLYGDMNMLADAMKAVRDRNEIQKLKCTVYMGISHLDSVLSEDLSDPWVVPVQAGAALTEKKLCSLRDDTGDNISAWNADFCECTALYWCWKNDRESDYIGLCHYRRRIGIPDQDIDAAVSADADIILTTPLYTSMVLRENFRFMLLPGDWEVVGNSLKEHFPAYLPSWKRLQEARCYPACNIGIFKRTVFEEYCGFAFSVMKDVYGYYSGKNIHRKNRYAGFIMELLLALYALHNKDRYKILYTDFDFLR